MAPMPVRICVRTMGSGAIAAAMALSLPRLPGDRHSNASCTRTGREHARRWSRGSVCRLLRRGGSNLLISRVPTERFVEHHIRLGAAREYR